MTEADTLVRVRYEDLVTFAAATFEKLGVPGPRAVRAAEALCHGDLTGMNSHGVVNLTRLYEPLLVSGRARGDAEPRVLADRGASVLLDAQRSLGLWMAGEAMDLAVSRAAEHGIGLVSVRGATHFGCAGHHALRAVEHGMIGVVAANCGRQRIAPPPAGRTPMLGTNPLSMAAPAGEHPPFLLDMSTTAAPTGKIRAAARAGQPIPVGWLADDRGEPVTDPAAFDRGDARLMWLGGPGPAQYKGFGLGLLVEILAALVPGAGLGPVGGTADDDIGYLVLAVAPAALREPDAYRGDASALFGSLLGCAPLTAGDPVTYPGVPEARRAAEVRRDGLVLDRALHVELDELASRLGIQPPMAGHFPARSEREPATTQPRPRGTGRNPATETYPTGTSPTRRHHTWKLRGGGNA